MGTEVAKYGEQWSTAAQEASSKEKLGGNFIKLAGGIFQVGEDPLPGNKICAVIIDGVYENAYYEDEWEAGGKIMPPKCFAMAPEQEDLAPHEAMEADLDYFWPQSYDEKIDEVGPCSKCPKNEWGSAEKGRGKACGNRRRLALIQAGEYVNNGTAKRPDWQVAPFEDESDYSAADFYMLKLPVTSGKAYSRLVKEVASEYKRPPYGVVVEISCVPDPKTQIRVEFEILDVLPDDWFPMIQKRHEAAREAIMRPYEPPQEDDKQESAPQNRISGLRRK